MIRVSLYIIKWPIFILEDSIELFYLLLSSSVALAVDSPEMFNRIAPTFYSKASMRFLILLWGEKSQLLGEGNNELPIFSFKEVMDLGQQSRKALFDSHDSSKSTVYIPQTQILYT